ncbi:hypothetical protein EBT31_12095 [bacterium]|nr:hypothetical protein [bacterium]NBX49328.1 hypothetical protein [bacterium]
MPEMKHHPGEHAHNRDVHKKFPLEETTEELIRDKDHEKLLALEKGLQMIDLLLRELQIPYKIIGSTALALHATERHEPLPKIPDDIDIALRKRDDLEKILRYFQEVHPAHITFSEPKRVGQRALILQGSLRIGNGEVPFELMADTEIVPDTAWTSQKSIEGIPVLTGEELHRQYGNIAKIEENVERHAQRILMNLTEKLSPQDELLTHHIAERMIVLFPEQSRKFRSELGTALVHFLKTHDATSAEQFIVTNLLKRKAKDRRMTKGALKSA